MFFLGMIVGCLVTLATLLAAIFVLGIIVD